MVQFRPRMNLVIPSEIPLKGLQGRELEECLYWLFDAMGARDLEWRLGGKNGGAPDDGRDLECSFYSPSPDGEMCKAKWWIEAKGRSRTVEPSAVHQAVNSAGAHSDVDVLVIVTNSTFSNPTRDWVAEWKRTHTRPDVPLWDGKHLERLISRHPEVAIRLFSEALTPQGKLQVIRERFWTYCGYAGDGLLQDVWKARGDLQWDEGHAIAAIASEFASGRIEKRPWIWTFRGHTLDLLKAALTNTLPFVFRAQNFGINTDPYLEAVTYIFISALLAAPATTVNDVLQSWPGNQDKMIREFVLEPILARVATQVHDLCTSDCHRISSELMILSKKQVELYHRRFVEPRPNESDEDSKGVLTIEAYAKPCKLGLQLSREYGCPVASGKWTNPDGDFVGNISYILHNRLFDLK